MATGTYSSSDFAVHSIRKESKIPSASSEVNDTENLIRVPAEGEAVSVGRHDVGPAPRIDDALIEVVWSIRGVP